MDNGFVFLHRKFKYWEWYRNITIKTLFLHCLLMANFKTKRWQGIEIKRGSFITSVKKLHLETGLSESQVRTGLNKLKLTSEIAIKTTNKYTVVTVLNYDVYQPNSKQNDKQNENEPQSNDDQYRNQIATTKNLKESLKKENNVNNDINMLFVNACELISEEFKRPISLEEVKFVEQWFFVHDFTYDDVFDALFYTIKTEGHRDDIKYMFGILKNRRNYEK